MSETPQWLIEHRERLRKIADEDVRRTEALGRIQNRMIFLDAAGKVPQDVAPEIALEIAKQNALQRSKMNAELAKEL